MSAQTNQTEVARYARIGVILLAIITISVVAYVTRDYLPVLMRASAISRDKVENIREDIVTPGERRAIVRGLESYENFANFRLGKPKSIKIEGNIAEVEVDMVDREGSRGGMRVLLNKIDSEWIVYNFSFF